MKADPEEKGKLEKAWSERMKQGRDGTTGKRKLENPHVQKN